MSHLKQRGVVIRLKRRYSPIGRATVISVDVQVKDMADVFNKPKPYIIKKHF